MTLKKLQLFFIFYILFIVVIASVFFIGFSEPSVVEEEKSQNIIYAVSVILSISSLLMGNMLFNKFKNEAKMNLDSSQQVQIYARGSIIRMALLEGALLYNIIFAFVFNLMNLLYIVAALFLYLITLFPTDDRYKRDLNKY